MKLSGVFASLPTPFDHRGEVYPAKIAQNVGRWNRAELSGYLVAGSAGEGSLLSPEEKRRVWELAAQEAKSGAVLLVATGAPSVRESVELTKQAAAAGYHAIVVPPPDTAVWGARSPEATCLYYRAVADQAGLPIVIENPPADDPSRLSVDGVAALAEHPNIIAVTDQSPMQRGIPSTDFPMVSNYSSENPRTRLRC